MENKLLAYVQTVMELEKSVFVQSELQKELKKRIGTLGAPRTIYAPGKETTSFSDNMGTAVVLCGFAGAVLCGLYGLFTGDGFFGTIFNIIECAFSGAIIGALIGVVFGVVMHFAERKRCNDNYESEFSAYQRELEQDRQRVKQEKEQIKQLQQLGMAVSRKRSETEQLLQQYYDLNVIHPDYQNLQSMCTIYELLEKGICDDLRGPNGVYKELRNDAKFKILQDGLETIISRLDSIRHTNVMLYNAIQEGNRNVRQLIDKTDRQIKLAERSNELMAINNYNQQLQLQESRYQSGLQTYAMIKWEKQS